MEEDKIKKEKNSFNAVVTVGLVGHCPIETLQELKRVIDSLPFFDIVYLKTSSGRLWIKEGDDDD